MGLGLATDHEIFRVVRRALFAVGAAMVVSLGTSSALAAPFELDWEAPPGCPSREALVSATRARLGEDSRVDGPSPPSPNGPPSPSELFVRGRVERKKKGYVVTLGMRDVSGKDLGEREVFVDTANCSAIVDPTSLVLAMMIAVARPREEAAPSPVPSTEPQAAPVAPPIDLPAPAPPAPVAKLPERPPQPAAKSSSPATTWRWSASASAVVSLGVLPNVGFGGALRVTSTFGPASRFLAGLEGAAEVARSVDVGSGDVGFAFFSGAAFGGYWIVRAMSLELAPVGLVRAGVMNASPSGFPTVRDDVRAMALVAVAALVRVHLGHNLRLETMPEFGVPLLRDRFQVVEGAHVYLVHQPSPFEGRLSLGIAWEFR